jgi:hypothetical protein
MKKLKLRSETVTMLTDNALDKVAGGTTATYCGSCTCTQYCWAPTDAPGGCASVNYGCHRLPE